MAQRRPPQGKPPLSAGEVSAARSAAKARVAALPKQPPPQAYLSASPKKRAEQQEEDLSSFRDLSASPRFDEYDGDYSSSHKPARRETFDAADDDETSMTAVTKDSARNSTDFSRYDGVPDEVKPDGPRPKPSNNLGESATDVAPARVYDAALATKPREYNFRYLRSASSRWLKEFMTTAPEPGVMVRCYVQRSKPSMLSTLYVMCADLGDGSGRELIYCSKYQKSTGVYYTFSMNRDDLTRPRHQRGNGYLGKLRSIDHASYVLYDSGEALRPYDDDEGAGDLDDDESTGKQVASPRSKGASLCRQELAVIVYHGAERFLERRCEVCLPINQASVNSRMSLVRSMHQIAVQRQQNVLYRHRTFVMHEKKSLYDPLSSCLVDFHGRAAMASTKSCQFIWSSPEGQTPASDENPDPSTDPVLFQMGKVTKQCFNVDYQFPLNMLQAFAIAITRFDFPLEY